MSEIELLETLNDSEKEYAESKINIQANENSPKITELINENEGLENKIKEL